MGKWKTFIHNGPIFPEEYKSQGFKFNGKTLNRDAEVRLWQFSIRYYDTDAMEDEFLIKNAWTAIKEVLPEDQIANFPKDYENLFLEMRAKNEQIKALKKLEDKSVSEARKEKNAELKKQFGFVLVDGVKQPLTQYVIEPEGFYPGRGKSPLRGRWKYAAKPEDITINYYSGNPKKPFEGAPEPPAGHSWKKVIKNDNSMSMCTYSIDVGHYFNTPKKYSLGAGSDQKIAKDIHKYNKAKTLVKNWDSMEKHILKGIKSSDMKTKQAALISWLILNTGIRVGVEKDDIIDNETVGASSLLVKNMKITL